MFSEVFKRRTTEEVEEYFLVGTSRTTPPIEQVETGWPKPWLFARVLAFVGLGALWRVKGDRPFRPAMLIAPRFLKAFVIPVVLHMIWNAPIPSPFFLTHLILGGIGWFVVFGFLQQGLRQVKTEQLVAVTR